MAIAIISFNSKTGLAKEISWGTAALAPTTFIPFKTLKSQDEIKNIIDNGKRGNLNKDFASYQGVSSGKYDVELDVYPDLVGNFLLALFGQDAVTGTSPYVHTFTVSNAQPPSYSLFDYDGVNERIYAGAVLEELGFKFTTEGEVSGSAKFISKASTISASVHTPTYATTNAFVGWNAALSIAGAANTRLVGGDITFKRPCKFTFGANNSQSPTKVNAGAIEVTGKLDFEIDDYTEYAYYLNNTQPAVVITFTNGANSLAIQMSKCAFEKTDGLDRSQDMVRLSATVRGLYNTTDAGSAKVTLTNTVATY